MAMQVNNVPATTNHEQLRQLAAYDLDVFAGVVMPATAIYSFPPFYKDLWLVCIKSFLELAPPEVVFRLLLVLPRGHAKTTFVKLFVTYGIIHKLFDFVLVVCADDDNASAFVDDVVDMLTHDNVQQLYGSWDNGLIQDNAVHKVANFMGRKVIFKAASVLSGRIRGSQRDMKRPDAIILDDVQTREVAESPIKSQKVEEAVIASIFKARSPHRCGIMVMGNSYPRNCLVKKLEDSGEFLTLRTGGILEDGQALWPELHSLETLKSDYRLDVALGKGAIFMAEVQNQPLESDGLQPLFPEGDFALTILPEDKEQIGAFITIDPAGKKRNSDDTAIGGHVIYGGDTFHLAELSAMVRDPANTVKDAIAMAMKLRAPIIFVEAVAYQETLAFWGNKMLQELSMDNLLQFVPLPVGSVAKLSRIRAWVGELLSGNYVITDVAVKAEILFQGIAFDPSRNDNRDDKLDTASMGTLVRNKFMQLVLSESTKFLGPMSNAHSIPAAYQGRLANRSAQLLSARR